MMAMDALRARALEKSFLCSGIDLLPAHMPPELSQAGLTLSEQMLTFAQEMIELVAPYSACFKVQIACYEAMGLEGMDLYQKILRMVRRRGELVIADIKRGDIGSTAALYAKAHFSGDFEADIVTLSAYMGYDAIGAYTEYFESGKGAFILVKTSNPSSLDFQELRCDGQPLHFHVLEKTREWGRPFRADDSYGGLGAVVAVNELSDLQAMAQLCRDVFLLVPGYGAQGARLQDIQALLGKRQNGVINVSRALTGQLTQSRDFRADLKNRAAHLAGEFALCRR